MAYEHKLTCTAWWAKICCDIVHDMLNITFLYTRASEYTSPDTSFRFHTYSSTAQTPELRSAFQELPKRRASSESRTRYTYSEMSLPSSCFDKSGPQRLRKYCNWSIICRHLVAQDVSVWRGSPQKFIWDKHYDGPVTFFLNGLKYFDWYYLSHRASHSMWPLPNRFRTGRLPPCSSNSPSSS